MDRVIPAFAGLAIVLGGCARNYMRAAVLDALPCPEDLSVVQAEYQEDGSTSWEGWGCGRRVSFTCKRASALSRTVICMQDGPAREDSSPPPGAIARP
jgi:hypothetical protein